jgi:hypothetical protein
MASVPKEGGWLKALLLLQHWNSLGSVLRNNMLKGYYLQCPNGRSSSVVFGLWAAESPDFLVSQGVDPVRGRGVLDGRVALEAHQPCGVSGEKRQSGLLYLAEVQGSHAQGRGTVKLHPHENGTKAIS